MLAYKQSGAGGHAVVLLHGLFGNGRNLATLAARLAQTRTVYAIDLPNHGDSPHVDSMSIPDMAGQVVATLDSLDIATCDLMGHSLGGKVAMAMALRYPQRVSRLLVADIAPVAYPGYHDKIIAALQELDVAALGSRAQADTALAGAITDAATRQFLLQNLRKQGEHYEWKLNLPVIARCYDQLRAAVDLPADGEQYEGSTLFVAGQLSDYIRAEYEPAIRALFPNFSLQRIAGAGHWLHAEQPELFASMVENFFVNE